ncbi:MAG TPA: hypothetical protein VK530_04070 [Candidatus Acidoferrum sp.]|nr:hypothetical protein [Candidatus Acidoferrum sp.]
MNSDLEALLEEWRGLTEAESRAISAEDWPQVNDLQRRKAELQPQISRATPPGARPNASTTTLVRELVSLEMSNNQLLSTRRAMAEREFTEVNRAAGTLRELNRAYGASTAANWSSYS